MSGCQPGRKLLSGRPPTRSPRRLDTEPTGDQGRKAAPAPQKPGSWVDGSPETLLAGVIGSRGPWQPGRCATSIPGVLDCPYGLESRCHDRGGGSSGKVPVGPGNLVMTWTMGAVLTGDLLNPGRLASRDLDGCGNTVSKPARLTMDPVIGSVLVSRILGADESTELGTEGPRSLGASRPGCRGFHGPWMPCSREPGLRGPWITVSQVARQPQALT
jgi:hypothetical protein